ncbi:hypothetical protein COLO4_33781 [Corchorus olitorius]|uniref:Uncharacterized protein n=1 Tax=Corchorus olitorius TaxID=93759 RepID=A0A1R3GR99_9ROSI|nr:hypothetical protein COLO4_33781 [Corchorus olitorius]
MGKSAHDRTKTMATRSCHRELRFKGLDMAKSEAKA